MKKLPKWYISERKIVEAFFVMENLIRTDSPIYSPNGKFSLKISYYKGVGDLEFSKGLIFSKTRIIAEVLRSDKDFWYAWINDYLMCGEYPQGYTIINLLKGDIFTYVDPNAEEGLGFCWQKVIPSPNTTMIAVEGHYWGTPHKTIYNFNPENPPLQKCHVIDIPGNISRWVDETTLELIHNNKTFEYEL